ncbi:adenosylcobinamide-GDP ribazoletransferase [Pseudoalteromonas sp. G4]|uniref:adenosylcobinamide-GDP ribazoletransferase n=1 Tax=Pseudoalteromonas sp. G4 TaxID=2992761 RepID=UPI00237E5667|nr:adenosylcobinamide-GDP ribazoletransferase [Pseudoalteromonas sp. G4]MDE3270677.1 adenosylcobinamide-GDP ribazoletransferase [Pseudoalteromonas sp. G4]
MKLSYEISLFKLALSFLTRIPVKITDYSDEKLNEATGYFPLVGALIGAILAASFYVLSLLFPVELAVVLVIVIGYMLTGGFHEDGLADVTDGFGGAFEPHKKLEIMKDSRLGTYGTLTLISLFAIKYQVLVASSHILLLLVIAHTLSRTFATSIIGKCPYVTADSLSKVKPVAKQLSISAEKRLWLTFACVCIVILFVGVTIAQLIILIVSCFLLRAVLIGWFKKHINGYTGDCLGAAQQIYEVFVYCLLLLFLD